MNVPIKTLGCFEFPRGFSKGLRGFPQDVSNFAQHKNQNWERWRSAKIDA
jgi:hypothetical protein